MSRAASALAVVLLAAPAAAGEPSNREINVVPIVGGDSDVGIGGGAVGDWAALAQGRPPFRWRLEVATFTTLKERDGGLFVPYTDNYLELIVPRAGRTGRLHVDARLSYTDERTMKYTGIGNASPGLQPGVPVEHSEADRLHPTASLEVRTRLLDDLYVLSGVAYTYNRLSVPADTILARDQATGPPEVRALLGSFAPHGVGLVTTELQLDTRDDEIVTRAGQFHTLRVRLSPRLGSALPYGYERLTATTRFYASPLGGRVTLRLRLVGDALFGAPPFYELARFDETPAIGGSKAVRGVPAQRYYGKAKAFGNVEATAPLWTFDVRSKRFIVGPAVFLDGGRTWTELGKAHPELDGTGLGLKYGVGGGLRVQEGRTFVLRLDLAWSPDATPVGAYFAAGDIF